MMSKEKNNAYLKFLKIAGAVLLFLGLWSTEVFSQTPVQTIRGQVLDAANHQPLVGANVFLPKTEPIKGTVAGIDGEFELPNIPVGRYRLEISYIGYQSVIFPEILLTSGHELVLEVLLEQDTSANVEWNCTVTALRYTPISQPVLSSQLITVEEVRRFPATFNDPARLAMTYAGVVNANDQANNMVVRGNSPNGMNWFLEGVEIVNPNHLSNAGTVNDRLTANGGGVNILSAQMLGTSTFMSGAFPAGNGNALSGIMNMKLREGNNQQHEFTGQLGLIGIDLAAEGPLSANNRASYLANYRYSTLGLLSAMGVELGDEAIAFQDLAFKFNLPSPNLGTFTFFGMGGASNNVFSTSRDTALWTVEKDQYDIRFQSKMGLAGLTHFKANGRNMSWRSTLVYSGLETSRNGTFLDATFQENPLEYDLSKESKLAFHSIWNRGTYAGSKNGVQVGLSALLLNREVLSETDGLIALEGKGRGWLFQPFVNFKHRFSDLKLEFLVGLHYNYFTFNNTSALEPRGHLRWNHKKHQISLAYGLHSKIQQAQLYFLQVPGLTDANKNLDFSKSHHTGLAHEWFINANTRLRTELYYQQLFNVPLAQLTDGIFSAINLSESFISPGLTLKNTGKGRNYGVEVSLQQFVNNGFYYLVNGSLYQSKYKEGAVEKDTRFNGNFIFNFTVGKELDWEKKGSLRTLGLNIRLAYIGGFRARPIDVEQSALAGYTIFQAGNDFSLQLPNYFKIDTRVYHRKDKEKYSRTFALDLQNTTNHQNLAFRYFDTFQGKVLDKYQLGLIPNLTWLIEF